MEAISRRLAAGAGVAALALGGLFTVVPGATADQGAAAAGCVYNKKIQTSGGKIVYTECERSGQASASGTVEDTDADGQCAYARVTIGNWTFDSKGACPKGAKVNFNSGWHKGNDAKVQLFEK